MKFRLVIACFLLVNLVTAEKGYLDGSVLDLLKKNNGSFSADIEIVNPADRLVYHIEEKYSYHDRIGQYVGQEKFKGESRYTAKLIYLNDVDELYQIDKNQKICNVQGLKTFQKFFWTDWAPSIVFTDGVEYGILGPNVLLEVLLEKNKTADCKERKCSLEIMNGTDSARIDYFFEDHNNFIMVPVKIIIAEKDSNTGKWETRRQINYFQFTTNFDKENPIVSANLPIGYGCKRLSRDSSKFPTAHTSMGQDFELEFESVFRFNSTKNEIDIEPLSWGGIKKSDEMLSEKSENRKYGLNGQSEQTGKSNFKTKIYYNKMYHNGEHSINVIETINELTNASMRTIYDTHTHVNYDILTNDESCISYHLNPVHKINYFYVQDLFVNHKEFFYLTKDSEYLGNYSVHNIPCQVFEKAISNFDKSILNKGNESESNDDIENEEYLDSIRKNQNNIVSNYAIVTHYYPIEKKFWGDDSSNLKVPMKIEIRLFNDEERSTEIAKQTINVASFRPHLTNRFEIYDVAKCAEHSYDYNWFLIKFDDTSESVQKYARYEAQIKNAFKKLLQISPLRLGEVIVDSDANSLYVTCKLIELAQVKGYFHSQANRTIANPTEDKYAESDELCARKCLTNKNCGAYSYCGDLNCKIWTDSNFDDQFDTKDDNYNWMKIETAEDEECTFHTRIAKFEQAHQSNNDILESLDGKIKSKNLVLSVISDDSKERQFSASELRVNIQPGRHTRPSSELEDEKINDERAHIKYNDLFNVTHSDKAFNHDKVKAQEERLVAFSRGLALHECQLTCINDDKCQSMSYCRGSDECVLTTFNTTSDIDEFTIRNPKCATSTKMHLARYQKHSKRRLTAHTEDKHTGPSIEKMNPNKCAAMCAGSDECLSFDFCSGEILEDGAKGFSCFLHQKHPSDKNKEDKDKKDKDKERWSVEAHCDHYTYKHSIEFNQFTFVRLQDETEFIGEHEDISLDACSARCLETEVCNTFDYCMKKDKASGHISKINCRMAKNIYSNSKVKDKSFECSTYSRINPKILSQPTTPTGSRVHGGLVSFLSILTLAIGVALGVGLAYYVIKNYISP